MTYPVESYIEKLVSIDYIDDREEYGGIRIMSAKQLKELKELIEIELNKTPALE